jgi:hypothetical protein
MKKEFHLVVSFDATSQSLMDTLQSVIVMHARDIFAAGLIAHAAVNDGSTKPDIHLYSDDFLMGKEDIDTTNAPPTNAPLADEPTEMRPDPTNPRIDDESAMGQVVKEVHDAGGPKSVGSPSFGDEEES